MTNMLIREEGQVSGREQKGPQAHKKIIVKKTVIKQGNLKTVRRHKDQKVSKYTVRSRGECISTL